MRPTTLSKFDVNVLQPLVNLGILTENAAQNGVGAIVAAPEHVNALLAQRGMMRATHKIICALDFENRHFGLDKLTRLKANPIGVDGYETCLSLGRTGIELLNEIKVIHTFIRSNNPFSEVRWLLSVSKRTPEELEQIFKHLTLFPPSAIRFDRTPLHVQDYTKLVKLARQYCNAPVKLDGTPDAIQAFIGNQNVKGFDIPTEKLLETAKFVLALGQTQPTVAVPVAQLTVAALQKELSNIKSGVTAPLSTEQLLAYVKRCQVLGPDAAEVQAEFEQLVKPVKEEVT